MQTFIGLSLVCASIYAITAWNFNLKQGGEFERNAEVVAHLLKEQARTSDKSALSHKLEDFFNHAVMSVLFSLKMKRRSILCNRRLLMPCGDGDRQHGYGTSRL